jgi:hypothetical protein
MRANDARSMPDLGPSFEQFVTGLKRRGSRRVVEEPRYGWAEAASGRSIASLM